MGYYLSAEWFRGLSFFSKNSNLEWVFLVNNMLSLQPQPFKNGLKREEKTHRIVMQIPPSAMTGEYVFCAIYHKEKMALSTLPINFRSNIAKQTVILF